MSEIPAADRIAVIGGGGFIGRQLVTRLAACGIVVRVVGLGSPRAGDHTDSVRCDVRDTAGLHRALEGAGLVYNLAAAHGLDGISPEEFHSVNVDGARSLCQAAAAAGVSGIVFTSSAAVYGRGGFPDETAEPRPQGDYAVTKLAAERIYRDWAGGDPRRSLVIVRPTVVFGPGGGGAGGRLLRHLVGPGFAHVGHARNRKSLAFVENIAAFLAFVRAAPGMIEVFNYADIPDLEVGEIAAIVRTAVGLPAAPRVSWARAWVGNVREAIMARLRGQPNGSVRAAHTTMRRLARDLRYNAAKAHQKGFHQPIALPHALAATARADVAWLALLSRRRG